MPKNMPLKTCAFSIPKIAEVRPSATCFAGDLQCLCWVATVSSHWLCRLMNYCVKINNVNKLNSNIFIIQLSAANHHVLSMSPARSDDKSSVHSIDLQSQDTLVDSTTFFSRPQCPFFNEYRAADETGRHFSPGAL